jgi:hypothetical protein
MDNYAGDRRAARRSRAGGLRTGSTGVQDRGQVPGTGEHGRVYRGHAGSLVQAARAADRRGRGPAGDLTPSNWLREEHTSRSNEGTWPPGRLTRSCEPGPGGRHRGPSRCRNGTRPRTCSRPALLAPRRRCGRRRPARPGTAALARPAGRRRRFRAAGRRGRGGPRGLPAGQALQGQRDRARIAELGGDGEALQVAGPGGYRVAALLGDEAELGQDHGLRMTKIRERTWPAYAIAADERR